MSIVDAVIAQVTTRGAIPHGGPGLFKRLPQPWKSTLQVGICCGFSLKSIVAWPMTLRVIPVKFACRARNR